MKRIKKICLIVLISIVSLLIFYNLYNIINTKILKKDMTSIFGYSLLEVMSSSMEPTILKEDFIIIDCNYRQYKKGDIITFYDHANMLVTHRIIKIEDGKIITQGDHNKTEDGTVLKKNVVGKYVFRIKGGGKVVALLKNPIIILIVIILIVLLSVFEAEKEMSFSDVMDDDYQEFLKYKKNKSKIPKEVEMVEKEAGISSFKNVKHKNNRKKRKKRAKRKQRRG